MKTSRRDTLRDPVTPRVSVVIVDRDRRIYLREALDSVLAQDVDERLMEVIVAKGYEDAELEGHLNAVGARHVTLCDVPLGKLWVAAARIARGEIIAFLDDDDLFHPTKIGRVLSTFEAHPGLTYYHNSSLRVDEHCRILDKQIALPTETQYIQSEAATSDEIMSLYMENPMSSSFLCIDRIVLERYADFLSEAGFVIDHVALALSLATGGGLFFDSKVLTYYRVHGGSTTHSPGTGSQVDSKSAYFYSNGTWTFGRLVGFLEATSKEELPLFFVRALYCTFSAKAQIVSSRNQSDWTVLRGLAGLAVRYRHPEFVSLAFLYFLHLLFPRFSARLFQALRRTHLTAQSPHLSDHGSAGSARNLSV